MHGLKTNLFTEMTRGQLSVAGPHNDSNSDVEVIYFDPDDVKANADIRSNDGDVPVTTPGQTIEAKRSNNLAYGFRDRNSSIFNRRRRAINALLQHSPKKRQQTNRSKKNTLEKRFKCDKCTYQTAHKSRLKMHGQVHSTEKPFQCDICNERMAYRESLKKHSLRRHNLILL